MTTQERPDYGIDAPGVVRNLAIAGGLCFAIAAAAAVGFLPHSVEVTSGVIVDLVGTMLLPGAALVATAIWMYRGSRSGKLEEREKLLDRVPWRGDETVLDVGCGRGLVLVGAAHRVPRGSAIGIDIWQKADLSNNEPDVPLRNAALEGVAERVVVKTADMRKIPLENGSVDVVVSRAAIHNLPTAADREAAIREIARVMRPGARAVIADIRHLDAYAATFAAAGCREIRFLGSRVTTLLCALGTLGALRPNTILVTKAAAPTG